MQLRVKRLYEAAKLPEYQTKGSVCVDLHACVKLDNGVEIAAGERQLIGTGIAIELPFSFEAQVRPRSGMAWRHGVTVLNAPGTIDTDYRGEIKVMLVNLGGDTVKICHHDRIAQLAIVPAHRICLKEVEELTPTARGDRGFGHTGT